MFHQEDSVRQAERTWSASSTIIVMIYLVDWKLISPCENPNVHGCPVKHYMDRVLIADMSILPFEGLVYSIETFPASLSTENQNPFLAEMVFDVPFKWLELLCFAS